MRKIIQIVPILIGAFLFAATPARAQFTSVSGTVKDSNGIPYANGTMSAVLVPTSAGGWTLSGNPYSGRVGPLTLDSTGTFVANFGSNAIILPAATKWQITVNSNQGGIAAPLGTGAQTFTVTMTISGATQNISATLNAAAPSLTNFLSAGGVTSLTATSPIVATPSPIVGVGVLSCPTCVTASGGGSIAITANQVAFGTGVNAIGGSTKLTWDNVNGIFDIVQSNNMNGLIISNSADANPSDFVFMNQNSVNGFAIGQANSTTANVLSDMGFNADGSFGIEQVNADMTTTQFGSDAATGNALIFTEIGRGLCWVGTTSGKVCLAVPAVAGTSTQIDLPTVDPTIFHSLLVSNITGGNNVLSWAVPGVTVNAQTGASYTVAASSSSTLGDRGSVITDSNVGATAITLPQAGTTGYANNYNFGLCNIGAGTVTITPATSTINGAASLALVTNRCAYVYSDNTNYFATVDYYGLPPAGGGAALSAITAATGSNTIASGNNGAQIWNWALTSNNQAAMTFGETTAATSGTLGNQYIGKFVTLAGSTAVPLNITSSLTGSQTLPALHITPTWNTSGAAQGILLNVTNTASSSSSTLIDLQVGSTSQFSVNRTGDIVITGGFTGASKIQGATFRNGGNGNFFYSGIAPTISSGFGTGASVTANNGTAAMRISVGTSNTGNGVVGLPTAATGWNCFATDITTKSTTVADTRQTASTTASATLQNYTDIVGTGAWVDNDVLAVSCFAY